MASQILADLAMKDIVEVLRRGSEALHGTRCAPALDETKLRRELEELLFAIGIANDGSEGAILFASLSVTDATHEQLAKQYGAIAMADDPLDRRMCNGTALAELNDKVRSKWAS